MLNTDQQIEKLNKYMNLASEARKTNDIVARIGVFTVYAGMVDFFAIQSARLLEQIILKERLTAGKEVFQPHEDAWFYNEKVSTRHILKEIKKFLPFKSNNQDKKELVEKINIATSDYIVKSNKFLGYRIPLIHFIGHPEVGDERIKELLDKGLSAFDYVIKSHTEFFKLAQPFRFGEKELKHFYHQNTKG